MPPRVFDQKFGKDFIDSLPQAAGVYEFINSEQETIYVGKAKNLKKRLSQYRLANRTRRHGKMRLIIKNAQAIRFHETLNEKEALLKELQLIQTLRPEWNVEGAFSFLYPYIGYKIENSLTYLCYTTTPSAFSDFKLFGAFRSRGLTRAAYYSLGALLEYVGHRESQKNRKKSPQPQFSSTSGFRQIPNDLSCLLSDFLKGESRDFLKTLTLALLENAGARKRATSIQEYLQELVYFFRHEALILHRARKAAAWTGFPVAQEDRDKVFILSRKL